MRQKKVSIKMILDFKLLGLLESPSWLKNTPQPLYGTIKDDQSPIKSEQILSSTKQLGASSDYADVFRPWAVEENRLACWSLCIRGVHISPLLLQAFSMESGRVGEWERKVERLFH